MFINRFTDMNEACTVFCFAYFCHNYITRRNSQLLSIDNNKLYKNTKMYFMDMI